MALTHMDIGFNYFPELGEVMYITPGEKASSSPYWYDCLGLSFTVWKRNSHGDGFRYVERPSSNTTTKTTLHLDDKNSSHNTVINTNYYFQGWVTNSGTGWTIPSGQDVAFDESSLLTTKFSKSYSYEYEEISLSTPTKIGYTFSYWTDKTFGGTYRGGESYKVKGAKDYNSSYTTYGDIYLQSNWNANRYVLTFDPAEGETPTKTINVTYDSTYPTLPTPTRNGYSFIGWFDGMGNEYKKGDKVQITADTTLIAHWSDALPINISYILDGGQFRSGVRPVESFTIDFSDFTMFENENERPYKNGYVFIGWTALSKDWAKLGQNHGDNDYVVSFTIKPKSLTNWNVTATLTANWAKLGKFYRSGGWRPIMATYHKKNGHWNKVEDVADPNIGTGKIRAKINGSWKKEVGSK